MNKERHVASEVLRKSSILAAALGIIASNATVVAFGILGYFTGDFIKPKESHA